VLHVPAAHAGVPPFDPRYAPYHAGSQPLARILRLPDCVTRQGTPRQDTAWAAPAPGGGGAHRRAAERRPGSSLRGLSTKDSSIGYPHCDACTCTLLVRSLFLCAPCTRLSCLTAGLASGSYMFCSCRLPLRSSRWFGRSRLILIAIFLHASVSLGFPAHQICVRKFNVSEPRGQRYFFKPIPSHEVPL
jgi:hypothetical protein